jgi:hypothetical protein
MQPNWKLLAEVGKALDISEHTIYQVVALAAENGETWVKQEPVGHKRWLVDTTSEAYLCHAGRWQQKTENSQVLEYQPPLWDDEPPPWSFKEQYDDEDLVVLDPRGDLCKDLLKKDTEADITLFWPELCQTLARHGLVVFVNGLAEYPESPWQWQWGTASGNNCPTKKQAILAALQNRLTTKPETPQKKHSWF